MKTGNSLNNIFLGACPSFCSQNKTRNPCIIILLFSHHHFLSCCLPCGDYWGPQQPQDKRTFSQDEGGQGRDEGSGPSGRFGLRLGALLRQRLLPPWGRHGQRWGLGVLRRGPGSAHLRQRRWVTLRQLEKSCNLNDNSNDNSNIDFII